MDAGQASAKGEEMHFKKKIKIIPGVTINITENGINSATIGQKGLSVNIGKKGTYLNTGIPGTGLYNREKLRMKDVPENDKEK